jgi:chromosome partitioning protein
VEPTNHHSARIIAIANQKGGVGKTTTAVSLSAALVQRGVSVLLIDLDPQGNATSALGLWGTPPPHLYSALIEERPLQETVRPSRERVIVAPSSPALAGAEVEMVGMLARESRLRAAIGPVLDQFEYVIVDCPPSLGLLTLNGLTAADEVLVPVQCEYLALEGLGLLTETVERVRRHLNPRLRLAHLLLTMYDSRTHLSREVVSEVRKHFPQTFRVIVPRNIRLSEAPSHGESIFRYAPGSPGAIAYAEAASELLERAKAGNGHLADGAVDSTERANKEAFA